MSLDSAARDFVLDPGVVYVNHGSFGACPAPVLAAQHELRAELEKNPMRFLDRELEGRLDQARAALAAVLGAAAEDLAFVANATSGVNTVLRSLALHPGDEIVVLDHGYQACKNAAAFAAAAAGAQPRVARLPFPVREPGELAAAVHAAVGPRTRLVLLDHITSPTALLLPVAELVAELEGRGVPVLVDGAHAPGMVPLDLDELGASYYTGNAHKWLCAPKGAAFLHVRRDRQAGVRPLVISHGASSPRQDRSRFLLEHDWLGTDDPTPFLAIPAALVFLDAALPGGLPALMRRNHELAVAGRDVLCRALGVAAPCPDEMLGSMSSLLLGPRPVGIEARLAERGLEIFTARFPDPASLLIRVSAQIYNTPRDYERAAAILDDVLG